MKRVSERLGRAGREKPLGTVPGPVLALLAVALTLQMAWHAWRPEPVARAEALPAPPPAWVLEAGALGDAVAASRLLMLWLQAFDNQPGISIPFRALDYARVEGWLERLLELDPSAQYPLLAASRLYAEVNDEPRQRRMLELVYRKFLEAPDARWRWLAHAALVAKHRLGDLPLALRYARALTRHAKGEQVPFWARDLTILVLEDMGEVQSARVLIGGLLDSGQITDAHELRFLTRKLEELEAESVDYSTDR